MIIKGKSDIIDLLQKIKNPSDFLRNILSVFTASTITQFIPILTAPILTRIYTPNDYGVLGILMGIIGLFGVFSTFGYSNAIIIAKTDEETNKIVGLCLKNLVIVTILSSLVIIAFGDLIANSFNIKNYSILLYLVPTSILLSGTASIFGLLATRYQYYKMISTNRVISAVISTVFSIVIGLIYKSLIGLIIGFIISQLISSVILLFFLKKKHQTITLLEFIKQPTKLVAKNFSDFPKYVLPSDFINNFSNLIPVFVLSSYAVLPQVAVGFYNMSNRILGLPIGLISNSIGDVFKQRAASDFNEFGSCRPIFIKTFRALLVSSIIPFAILITCGADIFAIGFGEKWRGAGEYSQILGVMFFFRFTVSPLSYVFYIANKQKLDLYLHLLFILVGFLSLYIGIKIFENIKLSLWFFSIAYSTIYMLYLFISYKISINHNHNK
jgi:O-antigen/teichoic acid export membrane protein